MQGEPLKVSKDTQKFVLDLADLTIEKHRKVIDALEALEKQQTAEANMERQKGWRFMWQRTPKPYLLMLGYLVFLASVGSFGYHSFSSVPDPFKFFYLISMLCVLILPLLVVFYLSYHYIRKRDKEEIVT